MKHYHQNQHGEEGLSLVYISWVRVHWGKPRQGLKSDRNLEARTKAESMECWLLTCSQWLLVQPRTTCLGVPPHRVGWALLHQSFLKKRTHKLVWWPVWQRHLLSCGSLFQDDSAFSWQKANQHTNSIMFYKVQSFLSGWILVRSTCACLNI